MLVSTYLKPFKKPRDRFLVFVIYAGSQYYWTLSTGCEKGGIQNKPCTLWIKGNCCYTAVSEWNDKQLVMELTGHEIWMMLDATNVTRAKRKSSRYTEPQKKALQCRNAICFNTRSGNFSKSSTTKEPGYPLFHKLILLFIYHCLCHDQEN